MKVHWALKRLGWFTSGIAVGWLFAGSDYGIYIPIILGLIALVFLLIMVVQGLLQERKVRNEI